MYILLDKVITSKQELKKWGSLVQIMYYNIETIDYKDKYLEYMSCE